MTKPPKVRLPPRRLLTFREPRLRFDHEQVLEDPKDGLMLFGPPPADRPTGFQYGVIGTPEGIRQFENWAAQLNSPIPADPNVTSSILYPGFESVFRTPWTPTPRIKIVVDSDELVHRFHETYRMQGIHISNEAS